MNYRQIADEFGKKIGASTFPVTGKDPTNGYKFSELAAKPGAQDTPLWDSPNVSGFGVIMGEKLYGLDIDDESTGQALLALMPALNTTAFVQRSGQSGARGHYYVMIPDGPDKQIQKLKNPNPIGQGELLSLRHGNTYLVGPQSKHPSGDIYTLKRDVKPITLTADEKRILLGFIGAKSDQESVKLEFSPDDRFVPAFYVEITRRLGVTAYKKNGFSYDVPCPLRSHEHDDRKPAAGFHHKNHDLKCFKCHDDGETADEIEVATALGIDYKQYLKTVPEAQADQQQTDKFKRWKLDELLQRPKLGYLDANREIPEKALIMTYGDPGVGKTHITLLDAFRIAQQHTVIYLAAEGVETTVERAQTLCQYHKLSDTNIAFMEEPINLLDTKEVSGFIATMQTDKPALIVIDNLSECMQGMDEIRDMPIAVRAAKRIVREVGCTVDLIHHKNKNGNAERGHTSLRASVDVARDVTGDGNGLITVTCSKARRSKPFETRYLRLVPLGDQVAIEETSKEAQDSSGLLTKLHFDILRIAAMDIFAANGIRVTELKANLPDLKSKESSMYQALNALKRRKLLSQKENRGKYYLTEAGKAVVTPQGETLTQTAYSTNSNELQNHSNGATQQHSISTPLHSTHTGSVEYGVEKDVAQSKSKPPRKRSESELIPGMAQAAAEAALHREEYEKRNAEEFAREQARKSRKVEPII